MCIRDSLDTAEKELFFSLSKAYDLYNYLLLLMVEVTKQANKRQMCIRDSPRHGYELVNADGEQIGEVTSGTMSPIRKIGIGMGYVQTAYTALGTEIFIDVRGRKLKAVVVKAPFRK